MSRLSALVALALAGLAAAACGGDQPPADEVRAIPVAGASSIEDETSRLQAELAASRRAQELIETRGREAPRLSEAANAILPVEAEVRCWDAYGWREVVALRPPSTSGEVLLGFAEINAFRIHLSPDACRPLAHFAAGARPKGEAAELELAEAALILAHESQHLLAGSNDAVAECRGLQRMDEVLLALGADERFARRLAGLAWSKLYALAPDEYRSDECRDGGTLDLDPNSPGWP